jgi:hypothetical protein
MRIKWAVAACSLVDAHQIVEETCCPRLQVREGRFKRQVPLKCWHTSAELTDDRNVNNENVLSTQTKICGLPNREEIREHKLQIFEAG